jgi:hypothetical protein
MVYLYLILTPLVNLALFEAYSFKSGFFYVALAISNLLLLVSVRQITQKKILSREFWNYSIFPVLFSSLLAAYSLLVVNTFVVQFLFLLNLVFSYYYLNNIYRSSKPDFLENISAYGNLLVIFFLFAGIYGFESFLGWPIWLLILAAAAIVSLVIYQVMWSNNIKTVNIFAYVFLTALLLVEISWAVYFLPFSYNTLGLIVAICYYLLIGFIKLSLAEKLTPRSSRMYLVAGFVFLTLILLTTKWA